jgi:hypothetical protein
MKRIKTKNCSPSIAIICCCRGNWFRPSEIINDKVLNSIHVT